MQTARPLLPLLHLLALLLGFPGAAHAQWDPASGDWLKECSTDVRVMTWNVQDGICSTNIKDLSFANWAALTRIVAAMKPDVLILQECADNDGNGTGTGVDSVPDLLTTIDLFLHGGLDPFKPGNPPVTDYVQLYDPSFDLPYVFVSSVTDGYNRDVVLSRFPFKDLNGDTRSLYSDIPFILADAYAPGGTGGIRGYQVAEIDLPDAIYGGDLVVGNSHLKAGSSGSDHDQRVTAARNIAYYIDYLYNGNGQGIPDPNSKILDSPAATSILDDATAVVTGGDWNEDESLTPTVKGPAAWIVDAEFDDGVGGTDGTDRDRTDMVFDPATDFFTGSPWTSGTRKYDYLSWQDSIVGLRRSFVFETGSIPAGSFPPELAGFLSPALASSVASDHRSVVADLILPFATSPYGCGFNPSGSLTSLSGGPVVGTTWTLGVDNPLGTQPAGSLAFLRIATAPHPSFPCGLQLPGFGMSAPGATGELLIDLSQTVLSFGPVLWTGTGNPAPFPIAIPDVPAIVGLAGYAQGAIVDTSGTSGIDTGLTEALSFTLLDC